MIIIKSFSVDASGDIVIENGEIQIAENEELIRQKIKSVISTNKGEWFADWDEGIDFSNILGKGVTEETIQAEIEEGIAQVDEDLIVSDFSISINNRDLTVSFAVTSEETDTEIEVTETWD